MKNFVSIVLMGSLFLISCDYTSNPIPNNSEPSSASSSKRAGSSETATKVVNYEDDIKPLLKSSCMPCHGPSNPKNWLSFKATQEYAVDILGSIKHEPGYMPMPMGPKGKLTKEQVQLVQEWIGSGMEEKSAPVVTQKDDVKEEVEIEEFDAKEESIAEESIVERPAEKVEQIVSGPAVVDEAVESFETTVKVGVSNGESFYKTNCASCHENTEFFPKLSGQNKQYLIDQINEFKNGQRVDPSMTYYAENILSNEQDIEDVAEYLSSINPCDTPTKKVEITLNEGEASPDITAGKLAASTCLACHTNDNSMNPVLFGQNANYLVKTLTELKSVKRPSNTMQYMLGTVDRKQMIDIAAFLNEKNECEK